MRIFTVITFLLLLHCNLHCNEAAAAVVPVRCARLYYADQMVVDVGYAEVFYVDWDTGTLKAGIAGQMLEFAMDDVVCWDYYISDRHILTSAETISAASMTKIDYSPQGDMIFTFANMQSLSIYNAAGMEVLHRPEAERIVIEKGAISQGIYFVAAGGKSFKVVMK